MNTLKEDLAVPRADRERPLLLALNLLDRIVKGFVHDDYRHDHNFEKMPPGSTLFAKSTFHYVFVGNGEPGSDHGIKCSDCGMTVLLPKDRTDWVEAWKHYGKFP
jgi:hypothetical protein